jgi:PD-(D/E)XK nuclease superfamily
LGPSGLPMLRTSERGTFKRCRWLWEKEYIRLLKPNEDTPPLMFGSMWHIAMHGYYKKGKRRGPHPAGLFEKAIESEAARVAKLTGMAEHELTDKWADRIELGVAMANNYIETYGKDEEYEVLATELPFQVPVQHPVKIGPWFWYTGILDLLMLHLPTSLKEIWDHKTTKAIQTAYLVMDDQCTSYYTYGVDALINKRLLQPGERSELNGLRYNFARKAMPDDRPFQVENGRKYYLNLDGSISKRQPADYFKRHLVRRHSFEKERTRQRVISEMADMDAVRREPEAGAYKNPTQWTCPGCWLLDVCELHEVGADWETALAQQTRTWDPYEAHEIYVGETR